MEPPSKKARLDEAERCRSVEGVGSAENDAQELLEAVEQPARESDGPGVGRDERQPDADLDQEAENGTEDAPALLRPSHAPPSDDEAPIAGVGEQQADVLEEPADGKTASAPTSGEAGVPDVSGDGWASDDDIIETAPQALDDHGEPISNFGSVPPSEDEGEGVDSRRWTAVDEKVVQLRIASELSGVKFYDVSADDLARLKAQRLLEAAWPAGTAEDLPAAVAVSQLQQAGLPGGFWALLEGAVGALPPDRLLEWDECFSAARRHLLRAGSTPTDSPHTLVEAFREVLRRDYPTGTLPKDDLETKLAADHPWVCKTLLEAQDLLAEDDAFLVLEAVTHLQVVAASQLDDIRSDAVKREKTAAFFRAHQALDEGERSTISRQDLAEMAERHQWAVQVLQTLPPSECVDGDIAIDVAVQALTTAVGPGASDPTHLTDSAASAWRKTLELAGEARRACLVVRVHAVDRSTALARFERLEASAREIFLDVRFEHECSVDYPRTQQEARKHRDLFLRDWEARFARKSIGLAHLRELSKEHAWAVGWLLATSRVFPRFDIPEARRALEAACCGDRVDLLFEVPPGEASDCTTAVDQVLSQLQSECKRVLEFREAWAAKSKLESMPQQEWDQFCDGTDDWQEWVSIQSSMGITFEVNGEVSLRYVVSEMCASAGGFETQSTLPADSNDGILVSVEYACDADPDGNSYTTSCECYMTECSVALPASDGTVFRQAGLLSEDGRTFNLIQPLPLSEGNVHSLRVRPAFSLGIPCPAVTLSSLRDPETGDKKMLPRVGEPAKPPGGGMTWGPRERAFLCQIPTEAQVQILNGRFRLQQQYKDDLAAHQANTSLLSSHRKYVEDVRVPSVQPVSSTQTGADKLDALLADAGDNTIFYSLESMQAVYMTRSALRRLLDLPHHAQAQADHCRGAFAKVLLKERDSDGTVDRRCVVACIQGIVKCDPYATKGFNEMFSHQVELIRAVAPPGATRSEGTSFARDLLKARIDQISDAPLTQEDHLEWHTWLVNDSGDTHYVTVEKEHQDRNEDVARRVALTANYVLSEDDIAARIKDREDWGLLPVNPAVERSKHMISIRALQSKLNAVEGDALPDDEKSDMKGELQRHQSWLKERQHRELADTVYGVSLINSTNRARQLESDMKMAELEEAMKRDGETEKQMNPYERRQSRPVPLWDISESDSFLDEDKKKPIVVVPSLKAVEQDTIGADLVASEAIAMAEVLTKSARARRAARKARSSANPQTPGPVAAQLGPCDILFEDWRAKRAKTS